MSPPPASVPLISLHTSSAFHEDISPARPRGPDAQAAFGSDRLGAFLSWTLLGAGDTEVMKVGVVSAPGSCSL